MKKLYKWISLVLCVVFMCTPLPVCAGDDSVVNYQEQSKQDEINEIFSELNSLALEKYKLGNDSDVVSSISDERETLGATELELDNKLAELGVIKIEPDDKSEIEQLTFMIGSGQYKAESMLAVDELEDYVERLTSFFSVYRYNGKYKVDGTEYTYSYIRVVDNKGKGLYTKTRLEANMLNKTPNTVADLLSYNFSYGFDQFLGQFKYSWLVEWTIGNISTVYKNLNPSAKVSQEGRGFIYSATIMSITQMTYFFVYQPQYSQWALTGSCANAKISITETLKANIGGSIKTDKRDLDNECYTGKSWYWYLENYVRTSNATHHRLGSFTLKCLDKTVFTFEPLYFRGPIEVLYK